MDYDDYIAQQMAIGKLPDPNPPPEPVFGLGSWVGDYQTLMSKLRDVSRISWMLSATDITLFAGPPGMPGIGIVPAGTTSYLRQTIEKNILNDPPKGGMNYSIIINSEAPYAKQVNDLPAIGKPLHVRHPPHYTNSTKHLYDPLAEGNFFKKIADYSKDRVEKAIKQAMNIVFGGVF